MKIAYNLEHEQPPLPPLEYINIKDEKEPIDLIINEIIGSTKNMYVTKGIIIKSHIFEQILKLLKDGEYRKIPNINYKFLISEEIIKEIKEKFSNLKSKLKKLDSNEIFDNLQAQVEIHITKSSIGNFIIKDKDELLQYSVDPEQFLLGLFISRQEEIIDIFQNKFEEFFQKAMKIDDYFLKFEKRKLTIIEKIAFILF